MNVPVNYPLPWSYDKYPRGHAGIFASDDTKVLHICKASGHDLAELIVTSVNAHNATADKASDSEFSQAGGCKEDSE